MEAKSFIPLNFEKVSEEEVLTRSQRLKEKLNLRRSVRSFSQRTISREIIENCILAASSAPSGANKQPYEFVIIESQEKKKALRKAAEKTEEKFYKEIAPQSWLNDLKPFKTNDKKPYLEEAPYLIAIFAKPYEITEQEKISCYYPIESTSLAAGILISTLHLSGLACLTHTPSPMKFLNEITESPKHYRPVLILAVGYPHENAEVPDIKRKCFEQIAQFI